MKLGKKAAARPHRMARRRQGRTGTLEERASAKALTAGWAEGSLWMYSSASCWQTGLWEWLAELRRGGCLPSNASATCKPEREVTVHGTREYSLWARTTHPHANETVPSLPQPYYQEADVADTAVPERCRNRLPLERIQAAEKFTENEVQRVIPTGAI